MENNTHKIPSFFQWLFRKICHPDYIEELEGDLNERFETTCKEQGVDVAKRLYRIEVTKMIRPSVIKNIDFFTRSPLNLSMIRNYSKISIRNLGKHKLYSFLNITGLAVGMAVALLIISLVSDLLKFDQFHENKDEIYRITTSVNNQNRGFNDLATTTIAMFDPLVTQTLGIENATRIRRYFSAEARTESKIISLKGHFADPSFLEMFSFPLISGDPVNALREPYSIVLTDKAAKKMFDGEEALGQTITMGPYGEFKVTGVLADIPKYSHLQFEVLGSMNSLPSLESKGVLSSGMDRWDDFYTNYIYLQLKDGQSVESVVAMIGESTQDRLSEFENLTVNFNLQPLLGIVPGPELSNKIGPSMTFTTLVILSIIAFLILLSACFNYTNLSIARTVDRSREIGVRKVIGAGRKQIIGQFLTEAIVVALFSLFVSIGLFYLIRPGFFDIIPRAEYFDLILDMKLLGCFLAFAALTGLLAGILPSVVLSRLKPVLTLKNIMSENPRWQNIGLRKVLVVFQFALSIIFIGGTAIVLKQYKYAMNMDLGFDQENILNVSIYNTPPERVLSEFSKITSVRDISFSSIVAGLGSTNSDWVRYPEQEDSTVAYFMSIDPRYLKIHDIDLIEGQGFTVESQSTGEPAIIINETFAKHSGWTSSSAVGQWVEIDDGLMQIKGVVEDFNYTHIEEPINPFYFILKPEMYHFANLKLSATDIAATMKAIESAWIDMKPDHSLSATFLDEDIDKAYIFLKNAMTLFGFLGTLAIVIASIGMVGMAMFSTRKRAKEIGIRKVFGASVGSIYKSLSTGYYKLVLVSALFASPLLYLLFDRVILNNFAFRVDVGLLDLTMGVVVVLVIAALSIGSQTWKAARLNPIDTLRAE